EPAGMTTIGLSYSLVKISTKCAPALVITSSNQEELVTSIHNANKWIDDWTGRTIPNGIELLKIK
ncbi:hypothetical protein ACLH0B_21785, partial [Aeromonas salmonicida]|uniref:hypothetical protein n=1 Tax=Aeromonas salmonicida TaxID=645 RepID=UPI003CFE1BC3